MGKTFLLVALMVGAGLVGAFHGRQRSIELCGAARSLQGYAGQVVPWFSFKDGFDKVLLQRAAGVEFLKAFRQESLRVSTSRPHWHLDAGMRNALASIANAKEEDFLSALKNLHSISKPEDCQAITSSSLQLLFLAAETDRKERKNDLRVSRQEFATDRAILCRSNQLIGQLTTVMESRKAKCSSLSCSKKAFEGLQQEIIDIQNQRDLNLDKMKKKWPASVVSEISC